MNDNKFDKIVIVSLCDGYCQKIGKQLSQVLDMMFCDAKELVEYELIDKKAVEKLCTKDYLERAERAVFAHIASFENVVVAIGYDYLFHNIDLLREGSLIVFLNLPKSYIKQFGDAPNYVAFSKRNAWLTENSTLTIPVRKTESDFVVDKIIDKLGGIL